MDGREYIVQQARLPNDAHVQGWRGGIEDELQVNIWLNNKQFLTLFKQTLQGFARPGRHHRFLIIQLEPDLLKIRLLGQFRTAKGGLLGGFLHRVRVRRARCEANCVNDGDNGHSRGGAVGWLLGESTPSKTLQLYKGIREAILLNRIRC